MRILTERQKTVLDYIENFVSLHAYPPTIREIAQTFEISVKGAYDHIKALEKKRCIRVAENRSRSIELLNRNRADIEIIDVPLLGTVAAGKPITAEENYEGCVQIPASLVKAVNCFALYVRGDSMRDAGILDGDLAIVEQRQVAENGEIVVALIEDEVTLKRFFRESSRVKLVAENPAYAPIYTQEIRILGRLRGLIRDYA